MRIRYVLGGQGYGKSHYLYSNLMKEAEKDITKKYYVIVPEQVNLQVQRELVLMSKNKGIMNVDVLSFLRLAHRTFEDEGVKERLILEDIGKNMVVKKFLNRFGGEFKYFSKVSKRAGFTEEMKSLITELMQYNVGEADLEALLLNEELSPVIKAKLHDTKLILAAFQEYKKEKYIVAEKLLDLLSELLENTELYRDAVFVFDGFTGFTPTQLKVIKSLMRKAKALYFAFHMDEKTYYEKETADYQLFYLSKKTVLKLNLLAEEAGAKVEQPVFVERYRDRGAISAIEKRIFRFSGEQKREDTENQISIKVSKSPKEEAELVLTEVQGLIRDEGYRYRDIGIITGDMEEYGELLFNTFKRANIPVFLDRKKNINGNPFIEFIRASLLVIEENYSYEAVMRYLRSGFSGILKHGADKFQNVLLARGIRGEKRYASPFYKEKIPDNRTKKEKDEEGLIEYIREKIYSRFTPLAEVMKDKKKTAKEKTTALYHFVIAHRAEEKLYAMSKNFEARGNTLAAKEYGKVFEAVTDIFSKMVELLGDECFDTTEYGKILEAGFLEAKAGFIPSGLDSIVIGDMKRTRFSGIRALFILGMNDGKLPKSVSKKGILTDREREKISKNIEIAPTAREKAFMELFYLYMMFSLPSEKLFISYSTAGLDGKSRRASYLVDKLQTLFTDKKREYVGEKKDGIIEDIRKDGGLSEIVNVLKEGRSKDRRSLALLRYYKERKEPFFKALVDGYQAEPIGNGLDRELALRLYGNLKGSITRLERFTECPYSHFLTYGLGLREREEFTLQSFELGNIYHEVLERFSKKVLEEGGDFKGLGEKEIGSFIKEGITDTIGSRYDILLSSGRNLHRLETIRRIAEKTAWAVSRQVTKGSFMPTFFEEAFLSENMKGRIDRIDIALSDYLPDGSPLTASPLFAEGYKKVEYARVIDYKSGKKSFDINDAYYGLDLQLPAYLGYVMNSLGKRRGHEKNLIVPVGAYYYRIDDPVRNKGEGEDAFLKELRLCGMTSSEPYSIFLTDNGLGVVNKEKVEFLPQVKSDVIQFATKKDGEISKTSAIYSGEDLRELITYTKHKMKDTREEILSGKISPTPYKLGEKKGCDYCKYESICRFKAKLDGYRYRKLMPLPEDIVFMKIREKNGEKLDG